MCLLAKKRKGLKSFLAESREKNRNYLFYPSAKSRRELKIKTLGVTFRGASAYYVQKSIAPQKQAVCRFSDENFFDENFHQKILPKKFFRRRKMKCWESSETRFPKVSRRSEPFSAVFGRSTSARPYRQRHRKKNHLIEAAPFGRLDQMLRTTV